MRLSFQKSSTMLPVPSQAYQYLLVRSEVVGSMVSSWWDSGTQATAVELYREEVGGG